VLMPRSAKMVESILAIWKCGAAYVPIDPNYPRERIEMVLADSGAKLTVASSVATVFDAELDDRGLRLIDLDQIDSNRLLQSKANLDRSPAISDLAYVIYTSGSTGRPKGVMIEHRGLLNHLLAMSRELGIGPDSTVAQTASHCFDISMWQFFSALVSGGRTVVYDDETVLNPDLLIDRFDHDGVQFAQFVPSYLAVFLDALERRRDSGLLQRLKWLVTIGEILKLDYARRWFDLYPNANLMNAYGPTEASDSVTHFVMRQPPRMATIPIGRPIQNMRVYVLDSQMNLCPVGVKGEICIGGTGVGRGYLGDDKRTRAAFVRDPFSEDTNARIYKTGDIGSFAPDGNLLFFGRKDHQVKIRGHRIELGEIENAMVKIEGVRNAAVIDREIRNQKALCAYVMLRDGIEKSSNELIQSLASHLPSYMLPDVISILPELPLTTGGKVDRNRLPALDLSSGDGYARPETRTEIELAAIWREVLELDRVGIDDHFTELGGHSLNAIQIVSRVRSLLRRDISFADIFEADTIRLLATRIDKLSESDDALIPCLAESEYYETSHAQKRIWLASRSREGSIAYNMEVAIWLEGRLDVSALKAALQTLINRHESLRTVFITTKGELRQRIQAVEDAAISIAEFDFIAHLDGEERALQKARSMSESQFDLARGPLLKAALVRVRDSKYLLAIITHHIVGDAWSLQVIFDELLGSYRDVTEGRTPTSLPLSVQYKDYAAWHNRWLTSPAAESDKTYWLEKLSSNMPRASIPYDFPRAEVLTFEGEDVTSTIDGDLVAGIRRLAERHRTSVYGVVLAAIYSLLFRYTNQEEIVVGTQTAGRTGAEMENQVGCFVNTLILRNSIRGDDTIREVIRATNETLAEAIRHQGYPFDKLIADLKVPLLANKTPLFEIQVDYVPNLSRRAIDTSDGGLKITAVSEQHRASKFALSFSIGESPDATELVIDVIYNSNLFRRDSIAGLSARLRRVLQAFVEDEMRTIEAINLNEEVPAQRRVRIDLNI